VKGVPADVWQKRSFVQTTPEPYGVKYILWNLVVSKAMKTPHGRKAIVNPDSMTDWHLL
jgi:hypothetical protein